ncbi:hypothetical protein BJ546DRAFT_601929 [Cryomyces antarcticus]
MRSVPYSTRGRSTIGRSQAPPRTWRNGPGIMAVPHEENAAPSATSTVQGDPTTPLPATRLPPPPAPLPTPSSSSIPSHVVVDVKQLAAKTASSFVAALGMPSGNVESRSLSTRIVDFLVSSSRQALVDSASKPSTTEESVIPPLNVASRPLVVADTSTHSAAESSPTPTHAVELAPKKEHSLTPIWGDTDMMLIDPPCTPPPTLPSAFCTTSP